METDNPAIRLLKILEEGKKLQSNMTCRSAWKTLLKTGRDPGLLMERLGRFMQLPREIRNAIQAAHPEETGGYEHWGETIQKAFMTQQYDGPWASFIDQITSRDLSQIKTAATLLNSGTRHTNIDAAALTTLKDKIIDLIAEIAKSNIDPTLKKTVLSRLNAILIAINEMEITGTDPIVHSIEAAIGAIATNSGYARFLKDHELGNRVKDVIDVAASIVSLGGGLPALSVGVAELISVLPSM